MPSHLTPGGPQPAELPIRLEPLPEIDALALVRERAKAQRLGWALPETASAEARAEIHTRIGRAASWLYVAEDGAELAGFVLGYPSAGEETIETDDRIEYLALLMVEPVYWGRGIGRQLLRAALAHAVDLGRRQLTLWTAEDNPYARGLYESEDYQLTGRQRISPRHGPLVEYRLDLPSN